MTDDGFDFLEVDFDSLKVREIEDFEQASGCSIDMAFAAGAPRGKVLRALAWVTRRRTDPDFTLEQAGELTVRLSEEKPDPPAASDS